MQLSKDFRLKEFTQSDVAMRNGIDNTPPPEAVENLRKLCKFVLQPVRDGIQRPIKITSGYRSPELNTLIGGSDRSQHCWGYAADIEMQGVTTKSLALNIAHDCSFDQIILEFFDPKDDYSGWVHVSYVSPERNRKQILTAYKENGKTKYKDGIA